MVRSHARPTADEEIPVTPDLLRDGRFIDLRAPTEFARGALPGALNLPLMTDREREQVGTAYARQGQAAAVELGHRLVSGATRAARVARWLDAGRAHPGTSLYCARGGLRSRIVQDWLRAEGLRLPRVAGGFKALRNACLEVLESTAAAKPMLILGGRTGTGKTLLIRAADGAIDLERLANHRGSAFGAMTTPQPGPVGFENALAVACLRHAARTIVVEDESRNLGSLVLPAGWFERMQTAPIVLLEADLDSRCRRIEQEYVRDPLEAGMPAQALLERLGGALRRIRRRLGGRRHAEVERLLVAGFGSGAHAPWIERLLAWYYDPMYDHQVERRRRQVLCRGDATAVARVIRQWTG